MRLLLFHLCLHIFMTGQTEIGTLCQEEIVQFCLVRAVAFCALRFYNRFMVALGSFYAFLKVGMAGETEGALFVQSHSFDVAPVGIMACETLPFCKRIMVRAARLGLHQVLVTLGAQF